MAYSSSEGKKFFADWLFHMMAAGHIKKIFDVGAGAGAYSIIAREQAQAATQWQKNLPADFRLDCSEIYTPYIQQHDLLSRYHHVYEGSIVDTIDKVPNYDLIIMGDVLEHLTREEAVYVVNELKKKCKYIWLSVPVQPKYPWQVGYKQDPSEWQENPSNEHLHEWSIDEMIVEFGSPALLAVFPVITVFVVGGNL